MVLGFLAGGACSGSLRATGGLGFFLLSRLAPALLLEPPDGGLTLGPLEILEVAPVFCPSGSRSVGDGFTTRFSEERTV